MKNILKTIVEYKIFVFLILAIVLFAIAIIQSSIKNSDIDKLNATNISIANYAADCSNCHGNQTVVSGVDTGRCITCHGEGHGSKRPSRYTDRKTDTIHSKHSSPPSTKQEFCLQCHSIPVCNNCHKGHVELRGVSKKEFREALNATKNCENCHGGFPEPRGHQEQRSTFYDSMHGWMGKCNTCHMSDQLRFKDLEIYNRTNRSESALLCANCHSKQYKNEDHPIGVGNNDRGKCVNCHNPHGEPKKEFIPRLSFITETINKTVELAERNAFLLIIVVLLILSIAFEYATKPKEGNVVLSKTLRVEHNKLKANAIKLKSNKNLNLILQGINSILSKHDVELIGVSGEKNDIVIFVSVGDNKDNLLKDIQSIEGISSAEYSEEYEVR